MFDCFFFSPYITGGLKLYLYVCEIIDSIINFYNGKSLIFHIYLSIFTLLLVSYNDYNTISAIIAFFYSSYMLLYINIINPTFKEKFPLAYNILTIVYMLIILVCIFIISMALLELLSSLLKPLMAKIKMIKRNPKPNSDPSGPESPKEPKKKGPSRKPYLSEEERKRRRNESKRKWREKNKLVVEDYNASERPPRVVSEESRMNKKIYNASEKAREGRREWNKNNPDKVKDQNNKASRKFRSKDKEEEKEVET